MGRQSAGPMVVKASIFLLVVAGLVSLYFVYTFYTETQRQDAVIELQNGTIKNLQVKVTDLTATKEKLQNDVKNLETTVENKDKVIESKQNTITDLTRDINNLISDIQKKTVTIDDLNVKLTGTQQKLEELNPTVRNYYVVGVTGTGQGVVIPTEIKVVKGSGSILVNVKNVDVGQQAQDSIRTAATVAGSFTGIDILSKDITVTFVHEGSGVAIIDGGSGGGAITSGMIAALQNKSMNTQVLITGTIESNQTIGLVGSVANKAAAAKAFGATTFLVPKTQNVTVEGLEVVEVGVLSEVVSRIVP